MDVVETLLLWILSGCLLFNETHAQIGINGCPSSWVLFESHCYGFITDNPKILEEADSSCWTKGARLLTVNSESEHQMISRYLTENDIVLQSTWYTSGYYVTNGIRWGSGDVIFDVNINDFWNAPPNTMSRLYNKIAYKYGNGRWIYGWALVSGSQHHNYICEMPLADVHYMDVLNRDYDYGQGLVNTKDLSRGPMMTSEPRDVVVFGEGMGTSIAIECQASGQPAPRYTWYRGNDTLTANDNERYTISGGKLTIQSPQQVADSGEYRCKADNAVGTILSRPAVVQFGFLHTFSPVRPDDQAGTMFEGVRISCLAPAYSPAVRFGWFKNHNTHNYIFPGHPVHFISQSGYLYFSEVQPSDDRTYYCVVTLVPPYDYNVDTTLAPSRVGLGTKLILRPGKTDNNYGPIIHTHTFPTPTLLGSLVRLECIAYGSLPLSYSWHRANGVRMVKGTALSDRNRVLTIPHAPLEAEGDYICKVTRQGVNSEIATISLLLETKPYFADPIKNMLVDPSSDIVWRCKAVSRPTATYSWYKDGVLLRNDPGKLEVAGNELTIRSVDRTDQGVYQCGATNRHGTALSTGELKILSFAPNFDQFPMKPSQMAALGGTTLISCEVQGAPHPRVEWLKDGGPLGLIPGDVSGRLKMGVNFDLRITEIGVSDRGLYTCKASNVNGEAHNTTFLTVVDGVIIDRPPVPTEVTVNRTAFLYCAASQSASGLDVTYRWSMNGHQINTRTNPNIIEGKREGITGIYIREATFNLEGEYGCEAITPLQIEKKSAYLTVKGPPGAPAGCYVDGESVTSSTARVIWTVSAGLEHGAPINSYDIEADTLYDPEKWVVIATDIPENTAVEAAAAAGGRADQRTATLNDLVPNTSYRFRVRAVNGFGRGAQASKPSVYIRTWSTAPYRAPDNVGGGDGKVGTLNMSWTPLPESEQCGPGIGYNLYWKRNATRERYVWQSVKLPGDVSMYSALVGTENYYLPYDVIVGAYNDLGNGPNSSVVTVYSAMAMPDVVPMISDVSGINISTCVVSWDPIPDTREHIKGRIGGYTIQYYWNDQGCNPMTGCEVTNLRTRNIYGQTDNVMLIDLEANSELFFRLQVFNSAGRGPKGEWRRGETATNAPLNYPHFVSLSSHGTNSVRVSWQGIMTSTNEEIITGYKVKWWEVQSDMRHANETSSDLLETSVILYGLQQRTVYQLRALGISAGGDGQMSPPIYFTLLGGLLRIDPTTTQICYEDVSCDSPCQFYHVSHLLTVLILSISTKCTVNIL
ncbi:contactin-5-like [Mya arenaria]|uniref:contactin-5-like n=1 Tax=Mya arenaria TaxID=6604 RepID=UPI0022E6CA03|nr:contactin-5-like [Mya arenaria]